MLMRVLFFVILMCPGCLCLPYAYPVNNSTPQLQLANDDSIVTAIQSHQVHIFRVDTLCLNHSFWGNQQNWRLASLSEIPLPHDGIIPTQAAFSMTYGHKEAGFYILGGFRVLGYEESHEVALRVYCPGFQAIEIMGGQPPRPIAWQPAITLEEQERTLDLLMPNDLDHDLALGSTSQEHSRALRFVAGEYERLATSAKTDEHKTSLLTKAKKLRDTAGI